MPPEAPTRLAALRWRPFRLPLRHRFEAAHGALSDRLGVLVEVTTPDGAHGIGEASPLPSLGDGTSADVLALLEARARVILRNPLSALHGLEGGPERGGVTALRCALDVATLDLEGRREGRSVASLLAARPARRVEVNAVIGGGTAEDAVAYALDATEAGYRVLKLKVGGDVAADVARVLAVRAACPEAAIRLDANGAWTEQAAREALEGLSEANIELIEQPVRASAVLALGRLRRVGPIEIAADEVVSEPELLDRVIEERAASLLVLKPMRLGGLRPSLELARRAEAAGLRAFVTTTFDSSIGTAAALQLAAALGTGRPADGLSTGAHLADDLTRRSLVPRGGAMRLPTAPGLGVDVDAAALERLATGPWSEVRARR